MLSSNFQNRIVGITVLVALGVLFLPELLDGKKTEKREQFAEIPLRPSVAEVELSSQVFVPAQSGDEHSGGEHNEEIVISSNQEADITNSTAAVSEPESKPIAKTKVEVSKSTGYLLKLGSFKNASNVNAVVKKLRAEGVTVYTQPKKPVDGQITKVFVGPEISQQKLKQIQQKVEKLTQLKGKVINYDPQIH